MKTEFREAKSENLKRLREDAKVDREEMASKPRYKLLAFSKWRPKL